MNPSAAGPDLYRAALTGLRRPFALAAFCSAVVNLLMLTGPLYMLQVYDRVLTSGSLPTLRGLLVIVVVLYGFLGVYDFLRGRLLARAAARLDGALSSRAMAAWLRPVTLQGGPDEALQPLRELETLRGFIGGPAITAFFDLPWTPLYLGLLWLIHPWLGALTLAGALVVALVAGLGRSLTRGPQDRAALLDAEARAVAAQSRRNADLIAASGSAGPVADHWWRRHAAAMAVAQRAANRSEVTAAFSRAFRLLLQAGMLSLGALLVLRHEISAGMIIAGSILAGRALGPVDQAITHWRAVGAASLAHRRLARFFAEQSGQPSGDSGAAVPRAALPLPLGQLEARNVSLLAAPAPGSRERARLLDRVSFDLAPGDGMAVIGSSGAGKSTLARVLAGIWTPDAGTLRLDGSTHAQWDPARLGRALGYLPQVVELLPGSIADNLRLFRAGIADAAVFEAARLAGVREMILALPLGYDTLVGGATQPLSGGQLQRIGLARAICGLPAIVVLDEPNAHLDAAGELALTRVVRALRARGSTVVLMTHRASVIAEMNLVLHLAGGRVQRFGPRDEVMRGLGLLPVPVAVTPAASGLQLDAPPGARAGP